LKPLSILGFVSTAKKGILSVVKAARKLDNCQQLNVVAIQNFSMIKTKISGVTKNLPFPPIVKILNSKCKRLFACLISTMKSNQFYSSSLKSRANAADLD
jgi:hypothetical protein